MESYHAAVHAQTAGMDHVVCCNLAMCLFQRAHFNDLPLGVFYCDRAIASRADYVKAYF